MSRLTVAALYLLTGIHNALWGATLPATDARLDLGPARLGILLLALSVGALAAMPLTGWLIDRVTARRMLRPTTLLAAAALTGPALAGTFPAALAAAVALGTTMGALNVVLTVHAVAAEHTHGRPLMATLHGTWALGAVAGGAATTAALAAGTDVQALTLTASALLGLAYLLPRPGPATPPPDPSRPHPTTVGDKPTPATLILLGLIGTAAFLTEGAATDWAGIHATRVLHAEPAAASLVYTAFCIAMTAVRFTADTVRARLGPATTIRISGLLATTGYALVLLAPTTHQQLATAITGWSLAGAGMAVVWPVVTSTLGATGSNARALSAVSTISYGGGLLGPALIGALATTASLQTAMILPAALALGVAVAAPPVLRTLTRHPTHPEQQRPRTSLASQGRR